MTRAHLIAAALRNPNGCTAADIKHIRRTFNKKRPLDVNDVLSCVYFPSVVGRMAYEGNTFPDLMPKSDAPDVTKTGSGSGHNEPLPEDVALSPKALSALG